MEPMPDALRLGNVETNQLGLVRASRATDQGTLGLVMILPILIAAFLSFCRTELRPSSFSMKQSAAACRISNEVDP
jgi:hypothetical protein